MIDDRSIDAQSRAIIRADISKAKYYPEDADFLREFEPRVQHYELYPFPS